MRVRLGLVEASQRLAAIDGDIETMKSQLENMDANDGMLQSLKEWAWKGRPDYLHGFSLCEPAVAGQAVGGCQGGHDLAKSSLESGVVKLQRQLQGEPGRHQAADRGP